MLAASPLAPAPVGLARCPLIIDKIVLDPKDIPDADFRAAEDWFEGLLLRFEHDGRYSEFMEITPARAFVILSYNPGNRSIAVGNLRTIVSNIRNGQFEDNGESVIISDEGSLNDGQHRLIAVFQAELPITTNVVVGVRRATRLTVDTGKARSLSNFLSMEGVKYAANSAAVTSLLLVYDKTRTANGGKHQRPTKAEAMAYYFDHVEEIQRANVAIPTNAKAFGGHSTLSFCYLLLYRKNPEQAQLFFEKLLSGYGLEAGDPTLYSRNRFFGGDPIFKSQSARIELILRTWNLWRKPTGSPTRGIPLSGQLPTLHK